MLAVADTKPDEFRYMVFTMASREKIDLPSVPARFQIKRYDGYEDVHSHDFHQIVIPLQGVMEMDVEGRTERVVEHSAAVIHEGAKHRFAAPHDDSFLIVDIASSGGTADKGNVRSLWAERQDKPFLTIDPAIQKLCDFFTSEIQSGRLHGLQAVTAGDMLVSALEQRLGIEHGPMVQGMSAALAFIEAHCHLSITVDQVAQVAGMSVSHFHDRFKNQLDMPPKQYILSRRMQKAARLLERTGRSIAQIALDTGYGDQAAFSRAFQRHYACSPAQWRRNLQESEKRTNLS